MIPSLSRWPRSGCSSFRPGRSRWMRSRVTIGGASRPNGWCDRMSASANVDRAWRVPPGDYLAKRSSGFRLGQPVSQYVAMRDGCRLAVDAYVPQSSGTADAKTFPTIAFFTPYYRRFKLRPGGTGEVNPNTGKFRDFFVPRGYAVVVVDVRGTGASFGTRDSFRSPRERDDSKRDRRLDRGAGLVERHDRRHRHLLSRRGLAISWPDRTHRGEGDRAAVRGLGHLCRQLFSGRHPAQIV